MGGMIAHSLLRAGLIDPRALILSTRRGPPLAILAKCPELVWTSDNQKLTESCDVVVLSVRPEQFQAVQIDARGRLVISVMAGVSICTIASHTGASRVVRAMPNAAARIGRSYTPWFAAQDVSQSDKTFVQSFFETCGTADELPSEGNIEYLSGLTGSGPAFPALLADAMLSHAKAHGLPTHIAKRAVASVIAGASQLLVMDEQSPSDIVKRFVEYRGTIRRRPPTNDSQWIRGRRACRA